VRLDRSIPGNPTNDGPWRPGDERIGSQNYFDLTAVARISKRYEFRLGVRNIFDREPPIVTGRTDDLAGVCTSPTCNGNTFPQLYDPLGRYLFAGVTISLDRPK
jgi:outer membrane receptor protein involved in Fe transport